MTVLLRAVFVWFQGGCFKTRVDFFFKYKFKPCGMWTLIDFYFLQEKNQEHKFLL